MSNHLEKARNNWDAILTVPEELRGVNGLPNLRFRKSTGTPDKRKAVTIASQYVAGWRLQIEQAKGNDTGLIAEAIQFRKEIEKAKDDEYRETLETVISGRAENIENAQGLFSAKQFYGIATGTQTPTTHHFDKWKAQLTITPRTIERYLKDLKVFFEQFPVVEDVTKREVSLWLDDLSTKGVSKSIQKRMLKSCRNYWKYLLRYNIRGMVDDPFYKVVLIDKGKKKTPREAFEPSEVVDLWTRAKDKPDSVLADLIVLAAYTGARIEELCSLMIKDVADDVFSIVDSKTLAGVRTVPIHSNLMPVIKRLKENSTDGYLLPNLSLDKFGARSNTMSGRFSKLKIKAGYGSFKVFHSFRHTLVSALVNAGVMEFHIADLVGHEKEGITGNVYAKAIPIEVKRAAIEKINFPFPLLT